MRSRSVLSVTSPLLLCLLALPSSASARYVSDASGPRVGAPWIQVYGAAAPAVGRLSGDAVLGYGISLQWQASERWALVLSGTRLAHDRTRVTPFGLGFAYGREGQHRLRPWVESGVSYYRFNTTADAGVRPALSTSGNLRDVFLFPAPPLESVSSRALGGYFGLGAERLMTSHLGLTAGARGYIWAGRSGSHGWDGLVEARSGLSYRF